MELLRELFLTGILAVLFSFLIAKLVSMAMPGGNSSPDSQSGNVDREVVTAAEVVDGEGEEEEEKVIMEELVFRERLEVEGFKSATKAESVDEVSEKVREFVAESFPAEDVKESANREEIIEAEAPELAQELIDAIVREEEEKLKGFDFDNEEGKEVNLDSSIKEKREEEPSGIELDVVEEVETDSQEKVQEKKVEIEVEDGDGDEDDGWEGIERSELEKVFAEAAKFVGESGDKDERLTSIGSDVQMELYGLHKIATEGPCREQPPMALKVSARAKWNAWQRLGNMSPEVAMEQYIAFVSDRAPGWMKDQPIGEDKPGSSRAANPVAVTPDLSTSSSQQNFTDERNTKLKLAAEDSDLTGGSDLENRPKE